MNELDELSSLLDVLKHRAERLRDLHTRVDLFENDHYHKAYRSLSRIDRHLSDQLSRAEMSALASL